MILTITDISAQDWRIYTMSNSNSPYDGYNIALTDTANKQYFNKALGSSGDQTIYFDNDTIWQSKLSQSGSVLFGGRTALFDRKNVLWEKCSNHEVYSLTNGLAGTWVSHDYSPMGFNVLDGTNDIAIDHSNNKWFSCQMGLVKFNDTVYTLFDTANSDLPFQPVHRIVCDKNDNLWITEGYKIAKFNGISWQEYWLPPSAAIYNMKVDSTGNIWFIRGSLGGGIYKFDGTSWINYNTSNSPIPSNGIWGITVDRTNNMWFSCSVGLIKFDGTNWTIFDASTGYPGTGNGYLNVDRNNNIWNCSGNGVIVFNETGIIGVDEIDRQMGALTIYPNPTTETVNIRFSSKNNIPIKVFINDISGRQVKGEMSLLGIKGENEIKMDVSTLKTGIYFIVFQSENGTEIKKLIKQ
jgi:ligand-binding sensor domain-containing protein